MFICALGSRAVEVKCIVLRVKVLWSIPSRPATFKGLALCGFWYTIDSPRRIRRQNKMIEKQSPRLCPCTVFASSTLSNPKGVDILWVSYLIVLYRTGRPFLYVHLGRWSLVSGHFGNNVTRVWVWWSSHHSYSFVQNGGRSSIHLGRCSFEVPRSFAKMEAAPLLGNE